jgi:ureidoacrylate peracid hydrolase
MTALPSPDRSALLVIDLQNGFCHPEGSFAKLGLDAAALNAAVPASLRLVAAARQAKVPIIFTRFVYRADYTDGGVLTHEIMPALADSRSLAEGTWDAELLEEFEVRPEDYVIDKNRYSAFYGTRLEPILTSLGVRDLVMCGVTTNMCVETSARDAGQRDYRTFVVGEACGELESSRHDAALVTVGFGFGWVLDADTVIDAWGVSVPA